jgi:hypothetical protein
MLFQHLFDSISDMFTKDKKRRHFIKLGYKIADYNEQNGWIKSKIAMLNKKAKAGAHYKFVGKRYMYIVYYDKNRKCIIYKGEKQNIDPLPKWCKNFSRRRINYVKANGHRIQLTNCKGARNPTYDELIKFLDYDKTEQIQYRRHKFVCADFAHLLHNHAEKYGIRAGWVAIDFMHSRSGGHACNVFKTIDKGLVFVDCTGSSSGRAHDTTVDVRVGKPFIPKPIHPDGCYYHNMGTVKIYKIYW